MGRIHKQLGAALAILFLLVLAAGCAKLPDNFERGQSFAHRPDPRTRLHQAMDRALGEGGEESGYLLLGDGLDAFVARAALARQADKGIDAQYYLLHDDLVGRLFVAELLKAADRGVRVRLLVDDMDMAGRDFSSALLDAHPQVEVRIFNPFGRNTGRFLQYLTGYGKQTRRAHNKSFTVDSVATILGGRNIGNEYFVADPAMAFLDLDVLGMGPMAELVAGSFDVFWNHELSYPISALVEAPPTAGQARRAREEFESFVALQEGSVYVQALQESNLARALQGYEEALTSGQGRGHVVWDHPSKLAGYSEESDLMIRDLLPYLDGASKEVLIISPYFVPGKKGLEFFRRLRERGVRVVVLTNALSSTDVALVHAGYAKYRKEMLRMGVELYELNRDLPGDDKDERSWKFYQSKASLHAKCFVIDRRLTFVGSLNFDARSVIHNTEIGMVIESEEIAATIADFTDKEIGGLAFKLALDPSRRIVWQGLVDGRPQTFTSEPYSGFWQRFMVGLMGLLPIDSQL